MTLKRIVGSHFANYRESWEANRLIAKGAIHPTLSRVYPLAETGQAAYDVHRNLHQGKVGVLCLAPEEGLGVRDHAAARQARRRDQPLPRACDPDSPALRSRRDHGLATIPTSGSNRVHGSATTSEIESMHRRPADALRADRASTRRCAATTGPRSTRYLGRLDDDLRRPRAERDAAAARSADLAAQLASAQAQVESLRRQLRAATEKVTTENVDEHVNAPARRRQDDAAAKRAPGRRSEAEQARNDAADAPPGPAPPPAGGRAAHRRGHRAPGARPTRRSAAGSPRSRPAPHRGAGRAGRVDGAQTEAEEAALSAEAEAERDRLDAESRAERTRLEQASLAERTRLDDEAAAAPRAGRTRTSSSPCASGAAAAYRADRAEGGRGRNAARTVADAQAKAGS